MPQPRATFTSEETAIVLSHYDLGFVMEIKEFPRGSHASAKVIITTDRGKFLLKRRPRGKDDPYQVAFAHSLQNYLAGKHFPLPHLIGTREENNSMLKIGENLYEMFEYIEGGPYSGSAAGACESAKTLALYHKLVHQYRAEWKPPSGQYHDAKTVYAAFPAMAKALTARPGSPGAGEVAQLIDRVQEAYRSAAEHVNRLGLSQWESQIVHADWHPGNMLFQDDKVVAVLDFDAARVRPKVTDIANGCLQFSMVTGGRDLSAWEARADEKRAREFLRGYDEMNVMSRAELQCVPYLMQEALIAQAVPPILKSGSFAGLDGFAFLQAMLRKVEWLRQHADRISLDGG